MFLKLEHDGVLDLGGTDLKPIANARGNFTLAVPRAPDLTRYLERIDDFGTSPLLKGQVPSAAQVGHLVAITEGTPFDRVSASLLSIYEDLLQLDHMMVEIELTSYLQGPRQRHLELQRLHEDLVKEFNGGQHGGMLEHEEIDGTRRAVIWCTGATFKRLVEDKKWQLGISWFESRPSFQTFKEVQDAFAVQNLGQFSKPEVTAPTVCVIDTGVSTGNPFLAPVTRAELVRSYVPNKKDNPSDEFGHGSGVASLVAYYALDLNAGGENNGKVWVASARILDENNELPNRLLSKTLREVVTEFVGHGVKIFNLSVNVRSGTWNEDQKRTVPRNSWIARSVDKLAREFDVIFVVSTGNLDIADVNFFHREALPFPQYFNDPSCGLLDPSQAALALTVGSLASTALIAGDANSRPLAMRMAPSPITRAGPGICRETKPELVELDGNLAYDEGLRRAKRLTSLQIATASNSLTPAITWDIGTSFAAARVSHKLARVAQDLTSMGIDTVTAPLLKAILMNSVIRTDDDDTGTFNDDQVGLRMRVRGNGIADPDRATACDDHQVTMYFQGNIEPDEIVFFEVPVPSVLADNGNARKRLTVTACSHPEVQRWGLEEYLGVVLKWRMFRGDVDRGAVIAAMSKDSDEEGEDSANGDAEEPEMPNELKFKPGIRMRSRGTLQFASVDWTVHRPEYSVNHYTLAVAAHKRWTRTPGSTPFAIVVRLEELGRQTEIYAEVQQALVALQVAGRV